MTPPYDATRLGAPDLQLAGFQVWVHSQPYAGSEEPHDADWLTVTAHCGASGASVWASGTILTASAFDQFARHCDELHARLEGIARFASDEPNVSVRLEATGGRGHVSMVVEITPDHLAQEHRFDFEIDQTYLPGVAQQCREVLARYPNPHNSRDRAV
jgi:hypothetical protein